MGSDSSELGFRTDITKAQYTDSAWGITNDSKLGLQLDAHINDTFHFTTQWVAANHAGDFFEQNLEWFFLRWTLNDDLTLRLGRVGADLFLLSDARNIGYTYLWTHPPVEFYSSIPINHFDGLDLTQKFKIGTGTLALKLGGGFGRTQLLFGGADIFDSLKVPVEALLAGTALNAVYEEGNWKTRISFGHVSLLSEIMPAQLLEQLDNPTLNVVFPNINALKPSLSTANTDFQFYSLGSVYDDGNWHIQSEAQYTHTQNILYTSFAGAYFSVGKSFDNITLFTQYGFGHSFEESVNIPHPVLPIPALQNVHESLVNALNNNHVHQQALTLGMRWDIYSNIALKTQWTHYWFGNHGLGMWEKHSLDPQIQQANTWSIGLDFIF